MVPAIGRAMSARHHTAQAGSKAQVADVYNRPANQDRIAQGALSADLRGQGSLGVFN